MTTDQLYQHLNYMDHARANRMLLAHRIQKYPKLVANLLEILFKVEDKISCRAAWILEFVCGQHLQEIIPYLDFFTENIHKVQRDAAVRSVAKVCEYLAMAYYFKKELSIRNALVDKHKEKIVEACFDWLINDGKIAPKAYAMQTLYLLGTDMPWIYPELAFILERDFQMQSAGYKARARPILKRIKNKI